MKKSKNRAATYFPIIIYLSVGALCGLMTARMLDVEPLASKPLLLIVLAFVTALAAGYLQVIIHESGHLVCGLISGYRFSSFRIGGLMLVKGDDGIRLTRLSIAGTGGQCLMLPPPLNGGEYPYLLYNLGGSLANALTALIFGVLFFTVNSPYAELFFAWLAIIGLAFSAMNAIPLKLAVDNDGRNILSLKKSASARRAFWVQLSVQEQISRGSRLRDLPAEWFELPEIADMRDGLTSTIAVFACNRLLDEHKFAEADALMARLLSSRAAIIPLHRNLLICERIYCELIGQNCPQKIENLTSKELEKFIAKMKNFPSVLRLLYARALISEQNPEKAEAYKNCFEKSANAYPYKSEMEGERELMKIAEDRAAKNS